MRLITSCAGLVTFLCASSTFANLPPTALTKVVMPAHGIYVTSDPMCMTGLVATRPLSATPVEFNFAAAPDLGGGDVLAGGIQCIVLVVKAKMTLAWVAGTYTGHTAFGTSLFNDSNCNAGSGGDVVNDQSAGDIFGCFPGQRSTNVVWPDEIIADMEAAGLSYPTTCDSPGAGNIFPIYLSTYSKCTGDTVEDDAIGGACHWETAANMAVNPVEGYRANTLFQAPTAPDDTAHGVKLGGVTAGMTSYTLVIDPLIGGDGGQPGDCGVLGPPKVSFRDSE